MRSTSSVLVGSGLSTERDVEVATRAACRDAAPALHKRPADLAVVFLTAERADAAVRVAEIVQTELAPHAFLGCTAQGVIAGDREVERPPAVAVWAASLAETEITTFAATAEQTREGFAFAGFPDDVPADAGLLMLCDPYTFPADAFLQRLNEDRPGLGVVGGMASGGAGPGSSRLFCDTTVTNGGAVGALVHGRIRIRPVVSQGCRPIGDPSVVTRAERNVILELGGRPPLERLRETFARAKPEDRVLIQHGVHVGIVIDEYKQEFGRGDFVIRGLLGADVERGAIAVGDIVEVGSTIQFHVRDAASADEDLRLLLNSSGAQASGALLFSCNGRGTHMFPENDHDARVVREMLGAIPVAGFFCAGEIGPVAGRNYVHGFTASLALFEDSRGA